MIFLVWISCHLQTVTVLASLFHFGFLFFFSPLIGMARTSKLCWIIVMRVGILVLFLTLEQMLLVFHHWEWCLLWIFCIWYVLFWGRFIRESICIKFTEKFFTQNFVIHQFWKFYGNKLAVIMYKRLKPKPKGTNKMWMTITIISCIMNFWSVLSSDSLAWWC